MDERVGAPVWARPASTVAERFGTDISAGLSTVEADRRLELHGANELDAAPPVSLFRRVLGQFTDPLVLLLLVAIGVSVLAWVVDGAEGTPLEAIVIAAIVIANAALGTWQEDRALRAVAALRRLAGLHATVVRDGYQQTVARSVLVPGDVIVLSQGDSIGADCRLAEAASLTVTEAALTGESAPVEKSVRPVPPGTVLAERTCIGHQGTAVTSGRGLGVVVATGMDSELGRIAALIDDADRELTPLQIQIDWLSRVLGAVVLVLSAIVVTAIMVTSELTSFGDYLDAFLVGVSLAVAAVPEGLPAILTIVLALGVQRMADHHAIVKRLSSVETLGSASVICTDKTGTLTRNEMTVVTAMVPSGRAELTGVGYEPVGELVTSEGDDVAPHVGDEIAQLLYAASVASDASLHRTPAGEWQVSGDPTEIALLVADRKAGTSTHGSGRPERVDEVPFDSDRKLMSTVHLAAWAHDMVEQGRFVLFTKGAPDILLDRCVAERVGRDDHPLTDDRRRRWRAAVDALAADALRPLAVAYRPLGPDEVVSAESEDGLVLLGVVGIADPPRQEVVDAIGDAHAGGVRVIMITGDHPKTASSIAGRLGLDRSGSGVVTGAEIDAMSDAELSTTVAGTDVFARVEPAHKLRLVRALQGRGNITAMTGDGVNDAPALQQADIGVAMGINGTEVSKEAADVILADDNFATILRAVREGREIFSDIRKFLRYLLASNSGEVLVVFLGVLLAVPLGISGDAGELAVPLLATQILWINLVTDGALALALGVDPAVEDVMSRPPRGIGERIIDRAMLRTIVVVGVASAIAGLAALDLGLPGGLLGGGGDLGTARTMAFTTVVLAQVGNAFSARSDQVSVVVDLFANRLLWAAAAVTVAAQVAVVHLPWLSSAFETEALSPAEWAVCAALAVGVLVVVEIMKWFVRGQDRRHPR